MKRQFATYLVLVLMAFAPAHAADITLAPGVDRQSSDGRVVTLFDAEAVNATATVTSNGLELWRVGFFGLHYRCTSAGGTPDVTIVWQESSTLEATEFVDVVTVHANLTAETWQIQAIQPPPMRYGRLKITGNAGNPADSLCTARIFVQG